MSGLDNLTKRLEFRGGAIQTDRMNYDKLSSLKKALLYSYQATTILLQDETGEYNREFRCLINPDKTKADYDNQIISIPYEDIQLNAAKTGKASQGQVKTLIAPGSTFYDTQSETYWIVYLWYKKEKAYFRAEIRCCDKEVEINGHNYKVYYRGPVETTEVWGQKSNITWSSPNYSAIIYITKNEETLNYFHRFQKIFIDNEPWEIVAVDDESGDGIIEVQLAETYKNTIEQEQIKKELESQKPEVIDKELPQIIGATKVKPYDTINYQVKNITGGKWQVDSKKVIILSQTDNEVVIEIATGKSGKFNLTYKMENEEDSIILPIVIESI